MSTFFQKLTPFLTKSSVKPTKAKARLHTLSQLNLADATHQQDFLAWFNQQADSPTLEAGLASLCANNQQAYLADLAQTHQPLSLALIQLAPDVHLALSCLNQLKAEQATWLHLALTSKVVQLRQAAAEKITDLNLIEQLAKNANNKGLQRLARQKIQAFKQEQEAEIAQQQAIEEVLLQLKSLTQAKDPQLFSAKLQHLKQRWQEVIGQEAAKQEITPALTQTYQQLLNLANAQEQEILDAAKQAEEKQRALEKQQQEKQAAEAEALAKQAALAEEKRLAAAAKKAAKAVAKTSDARIKQVAKAKQFVEQIYQLETLLNQGEVQAATKLNNKLGQQLLNHPAAAKVTAKQLQKYKHLAARLQELNAWQGFAAAPKRQELLEQMQALAADTTMQVQIKANKIQQLQSQWQELGSAAANKEIWLAFKQASTTAFKPCKIWFKEQNQHKNYNQEQRHIICTELENLAASQALQDLSEDALDKLLQEAHSQWHRFNLVGRVEGKNLASRFQQAIQPLKDQLYSLRQVNIDAKKHLIAQAQSLLTEELLAGGLATQASLNLAIATNKQLQEDWRKLGRAPGSLEPRLWKEFRAACDELFNLKSQQQKEERKLRKQEEAARQEALASANLVNNPATTSAENSVQLEGQMYQQLKELIKK